MAGLCEGGNEPRGSLKASQRQIHKERSLTPVSERVGVVGRKRGKCTASHNVLVSRIFATADIESFTCSDLDIPDLHHPCNQQVPTRFTLSIFWPCTGARDDFKKDSVFGLLIRSCVRAWVGSPFGLIEWFLPRFFPAVGLKPDGLWRCAVSSTQKFLVQQHITTSKHQANKQLNSKQRQLFLTQPTTSNVRSEFNIDLCRSLISADIPLYKLKNKVFREFLEKYTQHTIPDESTLRKTYAPSIYDETIQKIRDEIKDSSIWVSIDETPDKEGRLVGNVVIGLLSEQYSERILLHCDVLEKCNNKTIVKLFNEAMGILWPKGIMYDNVLFFISDAAPYMVKAGQALSVVYPKLTHFTCVAHAFHRVAEVVRDNFLK
ncbi:hypothetical protein ANN_12386 [Periplaneta americana]|uniref:DUF659 domain-containing protein n=1 Tax=Periplaneta americana TaxID=6978 RepID=A0ABQ8THS9_PERAM|nr:hypothetical protein ANN_12386 [Periplaneta americana]